MFGFGKSRSVKIVERYVAALNARDLAAIGDILARDCRFVDSHGEWIEGRAQVLAATAQLFALEAHFALAIARCVERDGEVLLRGSASADNPALTGDCLWRARVEEDKLVYWQSYGPPEAPHIARILAADPV